MDLERDMNERQCCILYRVLLSLAIAVVVVLTVIAAKLEIYEHRRLAGPVPAYSGDAGPVITAGAGEAAPESEGARPCPCGGQCRNG